MMQELRVHGLARYITRHRFLHIAWISPNTSLNPKPCKQGVLGKGSGDSVGMYGDTWH